MNTGILDAANLGWKLAFATDDAARTREGLDRQGFDREGLLDSYEQERRPVARQVLALTHLVFFAEASTNPLAAFVRGTLVPHVAPPCRCCSGSVSSWPRSCASCPRDGSGTGTAPSRSTAHHRAMGLGLGTGCGTRT